MNDDDESSKLSNAVHKRYSAVGVTQPLFGTVQNENYGYADNMVDDEKSKTVANKEDDLRTSATVDSEEDSEAVESDDHEEASTSNAVYDEHEIDPNKEKNVAEEASVNQAVFDDSEVSYNERDTNTPESSSSVLLTYHGTGWRNYVLEPVMLLYSYTTYLMITVTPNLLMEKICETNYNETPEVCTNLSNDSDVFDDVQRMTADYDLYVNLITNLPAAVVALIVASWSENHGRKTPMCFVILCTIIFDGVMIWYLLQESAPVYYILLCCIPLGLSGGFACMQFCIYLMAPEFSREDIKVDKFISLELSRFLGKSLGTLSCGLLYVEYGYLPIFWVSLGCNILLFVHTFLLVHDRTLVLWASNAQKVEDIFKIQKNTKIIFQSVVKKRKNQGRSQLCILIVFLPLISQFASGLGGIQYLYCNKMYGWGVGYFSLVNTIGSVVEIILTVLIVLLTTKCFKVPETWMGALGVSTSSAQSVLKSFANSPWLYYVGTAMGTASNFGPSAVRTRVTKIVEEHEKNMMQTVQSSVESLSPLVVQVIFTRLYKVGVSFFLGLAFLVGGLALLLPLAAFIWMACLPDEPDEPVPPDEPNPEEEPQLPEERDSEYDADDDISRHSSNASASSTVTKLTTHSDTSSERLNHEDSPEIYS